MRSAPGRSARLTDAGVRHFYVSNLPLGNAARTLQRILAARGRAWSRTQSPLLPLELILFVGEEDIEARQRSVASADVGLQLDLDVFGQAPRR